MIDLDKVTSRIKIPEIRSAAVEFARSCGVAEIKKEILENIKSPNRNRRMYALNLALLLDKNNFEFLKREILKMANEEDWEMREEASQILRRLLEYDFEKWIKVVEECAKSESVNLQRVAIVGSMIRKPTDSELLQILNNYFPLLSSRGTYVKKNLGPFALAYLTTKNPKLIFGLVEKWSNQEDEMVRWNLLMMFSQKLGKMYPDKAKEMVKKYKTDSRPTVLRARRSIERRLI